MSARNPTRPLAAIEALALDTGLLHPGFPGISGPVYDAVADGAGGWFVVGDFDSVGGAPHANAAHILSDGSVVLWNPAPNGTVTKVARGAGTVFLGGSFMAVGGESRSYAAAVDSATGAVLPWNPSHNGSILDIAVAESRVYLAGDFWMIGGRTDRPYLAALDPVSGAVDTLWDPPNFQGFFLSVNAVEARGQTVYVGGDFTVPDGIGGYRYHLVALDAATGQLTPWNPDPSGALSNTISKLVAAPGRVYAAGGFSSIGGASRNGIAAIDSAGGSATDWDPVSIPSSPCGPVGPPAVRDLALQDGTVYLGGSFGDLGGQPRLNLAAVDTSLGLATAWSPAADAPLDLVVPSGNHLLVTGYYGLTSIGGRGAGKVVAIDKGTWLPLPWHVCVDSSPTLLVDGNVLYVAGGFSTVNGEERTGLAALDATTGALLPWNPRLHQGSAIALASRDDTLYVGGYFTGLGGRTRNCLGAVSKITGSATDWNPNPNGQVSTLGIGAAGVYAGGDFSYVGTAPIVSRHRLACFEYGRGTATGWDPSADAYVCDLEVSDDEVYVAGNFWSAGQAARDYLAAVDPLDGIATSWAPAVNGPVSSIARRGGTLYVAGYFSTVSGESRPGLAAIEATTGTVTPWDPLVYGVGAIDLDGDRIYLGGSFTSVGGLPIRHFAVVTDPFVVGVPQGSSEPPAAVRLTSEPNPFRERALVRFALPHPDRVTLEVFDIAGRQVASLLRDRIMPAGRHAAPLEGGGLPSGVYLCRLRSSGANAMHRLVRIE